MMGIFHTMMFMQILFELFGDAGMKDALIQSSVIAEGSIESALREKCYKELGFTNFFTKTCCVK